MLIITGKLYVATEERQKWIDAHYEIVKRARSMPGCVDLYLVAVRWKRAESTCSNSGSRRMICRPGAGSRTHHPGRQPWVGAWRNISSAGPARRFEGPNQWCRHPRLVPIGTNVDSRSQSVVAFEFTTLLTVRQRDVIVRNLPAASARLLCTS
jgi:hypothetical protein